MFPYIVHLIDVTGSTVTTAYQQTLHISTEKQYYRSASIIISEYRKFDSHEDDL